MSMKSKSSLLLLMIISVALPLRAAGRSAREKCFIATAIGAVVVGGSYLLYKLFTREPSHEMILSQAQRLYDRLNDTYYPFNVANVSTTAISYTEQDLATMAMRRDMMMLAHAGSDLYELQNERDTLRRCLSREANKKAPVLDEMRDLLSSMKLLEDKLKDLKQFWREHASFFELYYYFNTVADCYKDIQADVYDSDLVRRTIMATSVNTNQSYPFLYYAENLKKDIDGLAYRMGNARCYGVMYGKAERLHDPLVGLLGTVVSLPEYKDELYLQKQHQLEQERVNAMREKAEAERLKAEALAQQAAAEREKANAMHAQAFATLVKPTTTQHVHVGGRNGAHDS